MSTVSKDVLSSEVVVEGEDGGDDRLSVLGCCARKNVEIEGEDESELGWTEGGGDDWEREQEVSSTERKRRERRDWTNELVEAAILRLRRRGGSQYIARGGKGLKVSDLRPRLSEKPSLRDEGREVQRGSSAWSSTVSPPEAKTSQTHIPASLASRICLFQSSGV